MHSLWRYLNVAYPGQFIIGQIYYFPVIPVGDGKIIIPQGRVKVQGIHIVLGAIGVPGGKQDRVNRSGKLATCLKFYYFYGIYFCRVITRERKIDVSEITGALMTAATKSKTEEG